MSLPAEHLARLKPIGGLSPARLYELAQQCAPVTFPLGSDPWHEMQGAAQFLYLLSGELKVVLPEGSRRLLVGGCDDALWPLGYRTILPVNSKAVTDVRMLRLDFKTLDVMMTWDAVSGLIAQAAHGESQVIQENLAAGLGTAFLTQGVLAQLPPAHIHTLLQRFERIPVCQGQTVVREGDDGDYFYVIQSGRASVTRQTGGAKVNLADLKTGDAFGEEALVADEKRNATVSMRTDGVLFRLPKQDFKALLQAPLLHVVLTEEALQRIARGAVWLDVRFPAEFVENGLPGAINVPLNEIRSAFSLLDRQCEYIVYCESGRRSAAAAYLLAQHGFRAHWLKGGLATMEM